MNVALFRNRVFVDVFKLRQRHIGQGQALNPMSGVLIRKVKLGTQRYKDTPTFPPRSPGLP